MGRRQTALPPENQSAFSTSCQYPPLSGLIRRSVPSAFNLAICFSTALGVIPIRRASAVALSVLSCESKAMIFSLLLHFSPYFLFCHHIMIKVAFIRNFYTQRIVSRNKSNLMGLEPSFSILIVRFPVPVHQHPFNVGSPVQDFPPTRIYGSMPLLR